MYVHTYVCVCVCMSVVHTHTHTPRLTSLKQVHKTLKPNRADQMFYRVVNVERQAAC